MNLSEAINNYQKPSHEIGDKLWERSRDRILAIYEPYLRAIARRTSNTDTIEDRYQACVIGLYDAAKHYSEDRGENKTSNFRGLLKFYIKNALTLYSGIDVELSPLSRCTRMILQHNATETELMTELGRRPTIEEISERSTRAPETVRRANIAKSSSKPIDADTISVDFPTNIEYSSEAVRESLGLWMLGADLLDREILLRTLYEDLTTKELSDRIRLSVAEVRLRLQSIFRDLKFLIEGDN